MTDKTDPLLNALAAANPLVDRERLTAEEESEARRIFDRIVDTPLVEANRTPVKRLGRGPSRRSARRLALGLCGAVIAVAILVTGVVPLAGPSGDEVVARAHAALSQPASILHFRAVATHPAPPWFRPAPDFAQDAASAPAVTIETEAWATTDGRYVRWAIVDERGRPELEIARTPSETRVYFRAEPDRVTLFAEGTNASGSIAFPGRLGAQPASGPGAYGYDFGAALRDSLANRKGVTFEGETELRGRAAYRLEFVQRFERFGPGAADVQWPAKVTVFLDRATYLPIEERRVFTDDSSSETIRYRVFERLPRNAETEGSLKLSPHPKAKIVRERTP